MLGHAGQPGAGRAGQPGACAGRERKRSRAPPSVVGGRRGTIPRCDEWRRGETTLRALTGGALSQPPARPQKSFGCGGRGGNRTRLRPSADLRRGSHELRAPASFTTLELSTPGCRPGWTGLALAVGPAGNDPASSDEGTGGTNPCASSRMALRRSRQRGPRDVRYVIAGSHTVMVVPAGLLFAASRPPWEATISWQITRPRPCPSGRVVTCA